jgi:hypothetical protein
MSTSAAVESQARILNEGYGSGAWHGPDLKAALADVTPESAYWRPGAGRHNIAEIAVHHAFFVRAVRGQISGKATEPFVLSGEEWFPIDDARTLAWPDIRATVDSQQAQLAGLITNLESGKATSPLPSAERFNLVLGITCHAVYHAAQIQLIKRLKGE